MMHNNMLNIYTVTKIQMKFKTMSESPDDFNRAETLFQKVFNIEEILTKMRKTFLNHR